MLFGSAYTAFPSTTELSHATAPVAGAVRMAKANPSRRVRVCGHLAPINGIEVEPAKDAHLWILTWEEVHKALRSKMEKQDMSPVER